MKYLSLVIALLSIGVSAQTISQIDAITVGTTAGNIGKLNGITIGSTAGNIGKLNGISLPSGSATGPTIAHVTSDYSGSIGSSPYTITVPSTTAGNMMVAWIVNGDSAITSVTLGSQSCTIETTAHNYEYDHLVECFNVTGSQTALNIAFTGGAHLRTVAIELSHVPVADPWDSAAIYENTFGALPQNLGTGTCTPTHNGIALAFYSDYAAVVTGYTNGSGWTAGSGTPFSQTYLYYESMSTTNGVQVGGTSGQATANGSGSTGIDGAIACIKGADLVTPTYFVSGACSTSSSTCNVSLTGLTTAAQFKTLIVPWVSYNVGSNNAITVSSITDSASDTYSGTSACKISVSVTAVNEAGMCGYWIGTPSGTTLTVTGTLSATPSTGTWRVGAAVYLIASGHTVAIDGGATPIATNDNTAGGGTNCSSCAGPALTISGTTDIIVQFRNSTGATVSSVSGSYTKEQDAGNKSLADWLSGNSGSAMTWTLSSSVKTQTMAIAFTVT